MTQILLTMAVLMAMVLLMSVGMIFKGIPMRKSCGGITGGDKSECGVCSGGTEPEACPDDESVDLESADDESVEAEAESADEASRKAESTEGKSSKANEAKS